MDPDWEQLSRQHDVLQMVPPALADCSRRQQFTHNERLFYTGTKPQYMLFLLEGEIRLIRISYGGDEVILQRTHRGFIAEASLYAQSYHCDALATSDGELLGFPIAPFRNALKTPEFRDFWFSLLSTEVRTLRARCERLALNTTAERIIHYLQSEGYAGRVTLKQSKKDWAAELGVSHESLYRTLASLQHTGRITIEKNYISLIYPR